MYLGPSLRVSGEGNPGKGEGLVTGVVSHTDERDHPWRSTRTGVV